MERHRRAASSRYATPSRRCRSPRTHRLPASPRKTRRPWRTQASRGRAALCEGHRCCRHATSSLRRACTTNTGESHRSRERLRSSRRPRRTLPGSLETPSRAEVGDHQNRRPRARERTEPTLPPSPAPPQPPPRASDRPCSPLVQDGVCLATREVDHQDAWGHDQEPWRFIAASHPSPRRPHLLTTNAHDNLATRTFCEHRDQVRRRHDHVPVEARHRVSGQELGDLFTRHREVLPPRLDDHLLSR